jgi:thymidylate kinase
MAMSLPIIILEGADGSGKSTLADQLRDSIPEAHYVHLGDFKYIKKSLGRVYVEAMLPAILGHRPVIMDRCWLSEEPYRNAFRPNENLRVDATDARMLERLALGCDAIVIHCRPRWETVKTTFMSRTHDEYLDNEEQLLKVREGYVKVMNRCHLPVVKYDWQSQPDMPDALARRVHNKSMDLKDIEGLPGAGAIYPEVLIVGESFAQQSEFDAFYQWPFASFSNKGCSRWLAYELDKEKIPENKLYWINADMLTDGVYIDHVLNAFPTIHTIMPLGTKATMKVSSQLANNPKYLALVESFPHPQYWKRFHYTLKYPFIQRLKELIK